MSKFLHSGQFRDHFAFLRDQYDAIYRKQLQGIRDAASKNPTGSPPPFIDESLEHHARTYVINGMFEALNWPLKCTDGLPEFIPEAPIQSLERGTRRFLDYFGLNPDTNKPLIIIEAKRPSLRLPSENDCKSTIANGLQGKDLGAEWNEILDTLKDYVLSVNQTFGTTLNRVVITNGSWLILFLEPRQTFIERNIDLGAIVIYCDHKEILNKSSEVWTYLEYSHVVEKTANRAFDVGELPFLIEPNKVKKISLGLKLKYFEVPTHYKARPQIVVLPIILIALQNDAWICVQRSHHPGFDLPHRYEYLRQHLQEVNDQAQALFTEVIQRLNLQVDLSSLNSHYEQEEIIFNELKGVNYLATYPKDGSQYFLIITGTTSHFLRDIPSVVNCRYHTWANSYAEGVAATDAPIVMASVSRPKSFFLDRQDHHCIHSTVLHSKTSEINQGNRHRCGLRSNSIGSAFCEIISIDEFLCCRTCVFECICAKSEIFELPCN